MSLHRVDPRFLIPHRVDRALVLDGLDEWRVGLTSAGIDVVDEPGGGRPPDLAVAPARLAAEASRTGAPSIIVEGSRERPLQGSGYGTQRYVLRPSRERPTLTFPLDEELPASYALEHWSVVDRPWKAARLRAARALMSRGRFPSWASPVVTVATQSPGSPSLVAAARELGVPEEVSWFLTFGQGDALSRNAFQLFRAGSDRPEWILKFARVAGYSERFDNDERGLRLAQAAGGDVAAHSPRVVGRLELDGVHASLETAAPGRRLRDILLARGDRSLKLALIERIGAWILELGDLTRASPQAAEAERARLRNAVVPHWADLGVSADLVESLPPLDAVVQHNDLGSWNVVAHGGEFVVLDWENAREAALPLWDLLYFLGDALVLLDLSDASPEELPRRMARLFAGEAPSSPVLFSWVRRSAEAARVPADAVGALATLCWLSHSRSADDHNVDLAAFTPGDPPRLHGLEGIARAWMSHPALGPGWRTWRG
ncbi:MAG TPA: hypothetical protein VFW80_04380 [Gaiellaceae bacterium]|nr:hypothetical protein [Gaiellaceae bacterium]